MRNTSILLLGLGLLVDCLSPAVAGEAKTPQGLEEMFRRKARLGTNAWPRKTLESAGDAHVWQPETLCFNDSRTGREVWRMTATPNLKNYYHNDINVSPWSADGRRMGLTSWRLSEAHKPRREAYVLWMVVDTDGSRLRATVNNDAYVHWSPAVSETYYTFGGTRLKGVESKPHVLYKVTVGDDGPATAMKPLLSYPEGEGKYAIGKLISTDGRTIVATRSDFRQKPYHMYFIPTRILPDGDAKVLIADPMGYSVNRDFGPYLPAPFRKGRYHGKSLLGRGEWYAVGDHALGFWYLKVLGSSADGGPKFSGDDGKGDFGEMVPIWVRAGNMPRAGKLSDPWKLPYPGHPSADRWGQWSCIANYDAEDAKGKFHIGANVINYMTHKSATGSYLPQSDGGVHCAWQAYADTCAISVEKSKYSYGDARVECFPYDKVGKNYVVCYTHNFFNGFESVRKSYYNYIRPAQSPDGTKVAFHSDFLNAQQVPDCYWAVAYYPRPPTDLKAARAEGGGVRLTWRAPVYTTRGWPTETDPPPPAREVKCFHVWRAGKADGPWREVGAVDVRRRLDERRCMMVPMDLTFTDKPDDGTWHYALTSEEWSRLESRELSEVLKVAVSAKGTTVAAAVAAPPGRKGFWKTPPPAPANFRAARTDTPGHVLLTWDEPAGGKVRYYNLYHSAAGKPKAAQAGRIASVAVGTSKYLDWLADPAGGAYAVTAVDRQGNESAPVTSAAR